MTVDWPRAPTTRLQKPASDPKEINRMEAIYELLWKNGISAAGIKVSNPAQKAKTFAHFMAGLWFFYSIGAWFGSRFTALGDNTAGNEPLLFGATLVVWFVAFFAHIALDLIRKKVKYG